jgi:hypothetical protein
VGQDTIIVAVRLSWHKFRMIQRDDVTKERREWGRNTLDRSVMNHTIILIEREVILSSPTIALFFAK